MRASSRRVHYPYSEYLLLEELGDTKHEYFEGEIYAMAGGTPDHAALAAAVIAILRPQLPLGCRIFTSDLRIRVGTGLVTYPDAAVVCGGTQTTPEDPLAATNPVLLLEVTSNSTEEYDRGVKLDHYRTISTIKDVLIVSHREPRVSIHRRDDSNRWTFVEVVGGESVTLESIGGAILSVDDVYREGLENAGR